MYAKQSRRRTRVRDARPEGREPGGRNGQVAEKKLGPPDGTEPPGARLR